MEDWKKEPLEKETVISGEKSGGSTIVDFDYDRYAEVEHKATHTDATAALILGILSIVTNLFSGFIGMILGVIGIVFGVRGRRDPEKAGMATAGIVCSVIGLVVGLVATVLSLFFLGFMVSEFL